MKRRKKPIVTTCQKCKLPKNPTTNVWCQPCTRLYYSKNVNCKCGKVKEVLHHNRCRECSRTIRKNSSLRLEKINNQKIINEKLVNFVSKIERRNGYCDIVDFYLIVDIWSDIAENTIKYDNLTPIKQIERMWRDLKKIAHSYD